MVRLVLLFLFLVLPMSAHARPILLKDGEYFIAFNGVRHWYRVAGARNNTPPLVIVHGGPGGSVYSFEYSVGPLLERFATVIYYDQRGSGRSDAPADDTDYAMATLVSDLDALREQLGADKITPLGFSFGGELALEYAVRHPEHLDKLIVQSSMNGDHMRFVKYQAYGFMLNAIGARRARLEALAAAPMSDPFDGIDKVWDGASNSDADKLLFRSPTAAALNNRLVADSRHRNSRPNTGKMERVIMSAPPRDPPLIGELRKISVPTLVMVGLYDRNVGVDSNREIAEAIPNAKLVIFDRSAHFPNLEEPVKYAATVRAFLAVKNKQR